MQSHSETTSELSSRESSVAFLQAQHAKTLKGLHEEIQKLQQKCASMFSSQFHNILLYCYLYDTGLTFELTMTGGNKVHTEGKI